jgi:nicotinamide-nucleotide amidase
MSLRPLISAELLSVGSELTVGETRDTNGGDLARWLTAEGVTVGRIVALPDDLDELRGAIEAALGRADLVVTTGGLGPTPDDLTREAIAAVAGESPAVDPDLEAWLQGLWSRRGMDFPELNLKQAWLIPSAAALPNGNGTAPGWWVDRPDGRVVVALPGPPREMAPLWSAVVLPRLRDRGLGRPTVHRTFRLAGIGESQVAALLGDDLVRGRNPEVATYARAEGVDVRISAVANGSLDDVDPRHLVDEASARVLAAVGDHVWAEGETTLAEAIGAELERRGWRLAVVEVATGGALARLMGDQDWLSRTESLVPSGSGAAPAGSDELASLATDALAASAADIGVCVRARPRGGDTAVSVVVVGAAGEHRERRLVFLGGAQGRQRAGIAAADVLLTTLRGGRRR